MRKWIEPEFELNDCSCLYIPIRGCVFSELPAKARETWQFEWQYFILDVLTTVIRKILTKYVLWAFSTMDIAWLVLSTMVERGFWVTNFLHSYLVICISCTFFDICRNIPINNEHVFKLGWMRLTWANMCQYNFVSNLLLWLGSSQCVMRWWVTVLLLGFLFIMKRWHDHSNSFKGRYLIEVGVTVSET